ncbi:hypothetical protein [Formosa sp. A9]|uniref:hypothetical protein n=1 Tax=Formosa sp. A9 TaxID=3442641 RepID=UPI003EC01A34
MKHLNTPKKVVLPQQRLVKNSRLSVIATCLIGCIMLTSFHLTKHAGLAILGICFVCAALVFNSAFLIKLIDTVLNKEIELKSGMISIIVLLLNIPVAYVYFQLSLNVMETSGYNLLAFY